MNQYSNTLVTDNPAAELRAIINSAAPDRVILLADTTTAECVVPRIIEVADDSEVMIIEPGDEHKTITSATRLWERMSASGISRSSLMINVGGGMITDLGGFVASTFKRGIRYVNVATSLLAMVDASTGGKTGINLGNLKNEVGVFSEPLRVVVAPSLLSTLPPCELLSGYGEMLKHGVIEGGSLLSDTLTVDPRSQYSSSEFTSLIERNIRLKERITREDPFEKSVRKALNAGHTIGHAFETLMLDRGKPVRHGYAVAWGLLAESILAHLLTDCPTDLLYMLAPVIRELYGTIPITCDDYPQLLELMRHDKKNCGGKINFTLPEAAGRVCCNQHAGDSLVEAALDILRDIIG